MPQNATEVGGKGTGVPACILVLESSLWSAHGSPLCAWCHMATLLLPVLLLVGGQWGRQMWSLHDGQLLLLAPSNPTSPPAPTLAAPARRACACARTNRLCEDLRPMRGEEGRLHVPTHALPKQNPSAPRLPDPVPSAAGATTAVSLMSGMAVQLLTPSLPSPEAVTDTAVRSSDRLSTALALPTNGGPLSPPRLPKLRPPPVTFKELLENGSAVEARAPCCMRALSAADSGVEWEVVEEPLTWPFLTPGPGTQGPL